MSSRLPSLSRLLIVFLCSFFANQLLGQLTTPVFTSDPTVHDPSVIKVDDRYYVFGSHLGAAWTDDLMNWTQISTNAGSGNTLIPNVRVEMSEALAWSSTDTFWAPDVFELPDGRFYMYYCTSRIDSPRGSLGLAVADSVEGPYRNLGIMLQSGMWGEASADGTIYDATIHPNAVDPAVFYDSEGKLWMVYGSYSGGIFILELNISSGFPLPDQGYGTKLIGGDHSRIEGAYILYNPETEYYYLFLSFGGLAADGGYNVRVARSLNPDGPYLDSEDTDMATVAGAPGTLFDDASIAPHGVKLMGNWKFLSEPGEPLSTSRGYISPGHNSAFYDEETGKCFLFFHTRFEGTGELHQIRVHQVYFNEEGWPVVAPFRYAGETLGRYQEELCYGDFKVIEHGKDISTTLKTSRLLSLEVDGSVSGYATGTWELGNGRDLRITLADVEYRGVLSHQWDNDNRVWVMAFSALSESGEALWGSQVARATSFIENWRMRHFEVTANTGDAENSADPDHDGLSNLLEYAFGYDPMSPTDSNIDLRIRSEGAIYGEFDRVFDPSIRYILERSESLEENSWLETDWSVRGESVSPAILELAPAESLFGESGNFWRIKIRLDD